MKRRLRLLMVTTLIYSNRPRRCAEFACLWKVDLLPGIERPDRSGVLVVFSNLEGMPSIEVYELRAGVLSDYLHASLVRLADGMKAVLHTWYDYKAGADLSHVDGALVDDLLTRLQGEAPNTPLEEPDVRPDRKPRGFGLRRVFRSVQLESIAVRAIFRSAPDEH